MTTLRIESIFWKTQQEQEKMPNVFNAKRQNL